MLKGEIPKNVKMKKNERMVVNILTPMFRDSY